jgi:hypothetical protein
LQPCTCACCVDAPVDARQPGMHLPPCPANLPLMMVLKTAMVFSSHQ